MDDVKEKGMSLTVYQSSQVGNSQNCRFPYARTSDDPEELKVLFSHDHTLIRFKNNYRCNENFEESPVASTDTDNEHSDNPKDWIYPEDMPKLFPDVPCVVNTSRNHMKQKGSHSPRPRFHTHFGIDPIRSPDEYSAFLTRLQQHFPFFDSNALDAGRFFFGNQDTEVYIFPGTRTLTEFLAELEDEQAFAELGETIPEGSRNNTMSHAAGKILKRHGDTDDAWALFQKLSRKCSPPLDDSELEQIWRSAQGFYHKKIVKKPDYVSPEEYNAPVQWETPIPFAEPVLPKFPTECLPPVIREYVLAVAESTQTAVDMSASAALAILALCQQGKFRVRGKADWTEPLNLFVVIVAEPSERKSAIINLMTRPVNAFEAEYNKQNAAALEASKMNKRVLERRQRTLEDQVSKGKADPGELERLAQQIADYRERTPMRLYVDDVTTEKLTSVLADNGGTAAIVSAEGGIFDMLSGIYSKNVNIDVMLKGHSGDSIRVDRIGRNSESIMNPALTVLLTVQPNVLSGMMQNGTFRGRGLTARFMYCMPKSIVGERKYRTDQIRAETSEKYDALIRNLLAEEKQGVPEEILLSPDADSLLEDFACKVETKLKTDYADISDWAGKLVGAVLRIAGVLCRASVLRPIDFLDVPDPLIVSGETMANAIAIGRYFTEHSRAAFSLMGADAMVKHCRYILDAIVKSGVTEFSRRDIMRMCRSFKTAEEIQPVLNHLTEYGYIAPKAPDSIPGKGRPVSQIYQVNPWLYENQM